MKYHQRSSSPLLVPPSHVTFSPPLCCPPPPAGDLLRVSVDDSPREREASVAAAERPIKPQIKITSSSSSRWWAIELCNRSTPLSGHPSHSWQWHVHDCCHGFCVSPGCSALALVMRCCNWELLNRSLLMLSNLIWTLDPKIWTHCVAKHCWHPPERCQDTETTDSRNEHHRHAWQNNPNM